MSRLDSFIRRVSAQRECINMVAALIADVPGPVLELGLGNGRTYDHLRERFPDREIFVFDRRVAAHPDCIPDDAHMFLGDFFETLPAASARIKVPAAFAHADVGTGDAEIDARVAAGLGHFLPGLMAPCGIIASDQNLDPAGWIRLGLPDGVAAGRYHLFRRP